MQSFIKYFLKNAKNFNFAQCIFKKLIILDTMYIIWKYLYFTDNNIVYYNSAVADRIGES